jgi:hypothetical protein
MCHNVAQCNKVLPSIIFSYSFIPVSPRKEEQRHYHKCVPTPKVFARHGGQAEPEGRAFQSRVI